MDGLKLQDSILMSYGGGDRLRCVKVRWDCHDGALSEQQRGKGERGRGEEVRATQQDDRGSREHADVSEQTDGSETEAVERPALLRGEENDRDGDGDEEDHKRYHGVVLGERSGLKQADADLFLRCTVTCHRAYSC
jgi:hypothetical protein